MRSLSSRLRRLEQRLGPLEELTPEEAAVLASDHPAAPELVQRALLKVISRYGLEAVVLASYDRGPLCAA